MGRTLVIAECGSSWDCDISKAFRLIDAAKECGADVAKFQWTSNAKAMAERRLGPNAAGPTQMYKRYLEYPLEVLTRLKAHCDSVGIEFAVTVYLPGDVEVIDPLVKRFKVSAFENDYTEFVTTHLGRGKPVVISCNTGKNHAAIFDAKFKAKTELKMLYCVSKYPTPLEDLKLSALGDFGNVYSTVPIMYRIWDGLSDHTTSTLTGALAVAAGATIIEKHIKLVSTSQDNPDYHHSLVADHDNSCVGGLAALPYSFTQYVRNIREAERCM